jgi:hypothetical protein
VRAFTGFLLTVLGAAIIFVGGGMAVRALAGLYGGALSDPLGQPDGAEKHAADAMIRGVLIGAVGALPFLIGIAMLKAGVVRRLMRRR